MNKSSEKVLTYLTCNKSTDAVSVDDLQKLAAENPYFPVSHFLLAEKLKSENAEGFSSQAQKTALYFSNPFWLQYQLSDQTIQNESFEFNTNNTITENNISQDAIVEGAHPITTEFSINELIAADNLAHETLQEVLETTTAEVNDDVENSNAAIDPEPKDDKETAPLEIVQAEEEMTAIARDTNEEAENFINHLDISKPAEPINIELSADIPPVAETEVVELEEEMAGVTHNTDSATEHFLAEVAEKEKIQELPPDDEHDKMFKNIKAMLDASSEDADADTRNAIVHIDPYYTIDYFASQGIKLELDQNPQDQLGQNLKKFTHWLRHMKKLGPEDATEVINRTETDADIQQIADSSNTVREVVTEAMASVLVKQGKKDKAIELYNKLSFLNPDKSAYFADQIKKLKGS